MPFLGLFHAGAAVTHAFSQYKDTLLTAATRRDQCLKPASMRAKHVIQAMTAGIGSSVGNWFSEGYLDAGDGFYDKSESEHTLIHQLLQRNTANEGNNQFRLPRELWDKLSQDIQAKIKEWT